MVGFVLFDPQDPMEKIVQKVLVGERPSLLVGRNPKGKKTEHRRHIIGYDILAKSLRKMLKGRSLGAIADWLDQPASWLDQPNRVHDLKPCDGAGRVMRSVYGVQGATAGWMKNATNHANNIFNGNKKVNLELSGAYTGGRDLIKQSWEGEVASLDGLSLIFCVEVSSGRSARFESAGHFYQPGTEVKGELTALIDRRAVPAFFRTEPGMRFIAITNGQRQEFDRIVGLHNNDIGTAIARNVHNVRMVTPLGGAFRLYGERGPGKAFIQKISRDFHWKGLGPDKEPDRRNWNLERGQQQYLRGGVDIHADRNGKSFTQYDNAIKSLHVIGLDGKPVYLFEEAIGGFNRGKYLSHASFK